MTSSYIMLLCHHINIQGVSSLRSLPPLGGIILFKTHEQQQFTYDCAHLRTRMRIFMLVLKPHPQSILRGVVCETNVQRASCFVQSELAKETRYSRGSFARNSSRQKTPTTESPPSVKQSRTTSNPERCSFVAFEPPKVSLPVDLHFLPHASNAPSLVSRLTLRLSMSVDNRTSNQTSALKRKKMF